MKENLKTKKELQKELVTLKREIAQLKKAKEESRKTIEKLKKNKQRYQIAAESSSDLIWEWDIPKGKLEWFGEIDKMLGYAPKKFPRTIEAWEKIIYPEDHDQVMSLLEKHLKKKEPYYAEYRVIRKDGTICYWTDQGIALRDKQGRPYLMIGACRDITEHKKAEKELKDTRDFLENLFMTSGDGIMVSDSKGYVVRVNRAVMEMLGYTYEEIIGKHTAELAPQDKRNQEIGIMMMTDLREKGVVKNFEANWLRKDGSLCPIELNVTMLKDGEGKNIGAVSIIRNITDRKKAEEQIHFQANLLQQVSDAIVSSDQDFHITSWNKAAEKIYGWKAEEVLGTSIVELLKTKFVNHEREEVFQQIFERGYFEGELIQWHKDGRELHILGSISLLKNTEGKVIGFVAIGHDITAWKLAEEEKKNLQNQLFQAQKLEAIGLLAGGVAHDFNNILTAIQGNVELVMLKIDETNPVQRELKQIHKAALRAANLTRQLLFFSRRHPQEFTTLRINGIISGLVEMLKRIIGEDITIVTELAPDLWAVKGDSGNIEQVLMNITANAKDAMPEGGKIIIKTENVILDQEYCRKNPEARPGRFVCISVADTGCGMKKEVIEHIFEPFFTTKEAGKGTGLGLSVVYGIVKQHEGWINVYSEPGEGSIFRIYLPALSGALLEETPETLSIETYKGKGERILLVEDEEDVLDFAAKVLEENGYKVIKAKSSQEAVEIFNMEKGNFHLIFTDVVLPDRSGIQLVEQLLSRKTDLKVLLSSGYPNHKLQWPLISERKYPFLQKPYSLPALLKKIQEVLK